MADNSMQQGLEDQLLLATKLYIPRARPTLLSRPRLLDRLEASLMGPLTLISAPTGSGKTVLLTDWISRHDQRRRQPDMDRQRSVAWLSLDSGDDDLVQFLRYLIAACQTLLPSVATVLQSLLRGGAAQLPPIPTVMTPLINDLARGAAPGILVLDDYHVVSDERVHEAVTFLIDHLPPQLHIAITTRIDPSLPLARWRAHGVLTELRAADLRFTADEASAFLTEVMRLPLTAAAVEALEQRTEGWIAGLQFAALAMRERRDLQHFVDAFTGSHRFVLDYLVDEVLLRQPPDRQIFLLRTAILDRMCSPLCATLLAEQTPISGNGPAGTSQALLEELEQANLFVVPLDDEREWYRYHHLFADVLRHRLLSSTSPDEVRSLHVRAATWYEQQGLITEAIHHSLQAADYERYARLLEQVWMQHMSRGELGQLQRWLDHLPADMLQTHPRLSLQSAWLLSFTADLQAVVERLDNTERLLDNAAMGTQARPLRDQLEGDLLALRGFVALRRHQIPDAIRLLKQAQPHLSETNAHMQGMNLHHLGLAHRMNHDPSAASRAFSEAVTIFDRSPETRSFAVYPLKNLGMIEEAHGRLRRAEQIYRQALEHAVVNNRTLPSAGHAYLCLGRLAYEWNDLPTATSYLRQAIELGRQGNLHQIIAEAAIELAPVVLAQESSDEVDRVLQEAQDAARRWQDPSIIDRATAASARVRLLQGRTTEASQWTEGTRLDLDGIIEVDLRHLTLARMLACEQYDDAQRVLHRLATHAEAGGYLRSALEAFALLAITQHDVGDQENALATLGHALQLAAPEGYIRTFLDAGPAMAILLEQGIRQSTWAGGSGDKVVIRHYARTLLSHLPTRTTSTMSAAPPPLLTPTDVEPLTARELEVLRLIAAGKSNGEIATSMVVAVSTVKAHINSIFGKLGVTSRTQALVRAREMQLF